MQDAYERRKLVIIGAGRHGRLVLDVSIALGWQVLGFLDDTRQPGARVNGVPVLGGFVRCSDATLHATTVAALQLGRKGHSVGSCRDVQPKDVFGAGVPIILEVTKIRECSAIVDDGGSLPLDRASRAYRTPDLHLTVALHGRRPSQLRTD